MKSFDLMIKKFFKDLKWDVKEWPFNQFINEIKERKDLAIIDEIYT